MSQYLSRVLHWHDVGLRFESALALEIFLTKMKFNQISIMVFKLNTDSNSLSFLTTCNAALWIYGFLIY